MRRSGRYKLGARTRAAGYLRPTGWKQGPFHSFGARTRAAGYLRPTGWKQKRRPACFDRRTCMTQQMLTEARAATLKASAVLDYTVFLPHGSPFDFCEAYWALLRRASFVAQQAGFIVPECLKQQGNSNNRSC